MELAPATKLKSMRKGQKSGKACYIDLLLQPILDKEEKAERRKA